MSKIGIVIDAGDRDIFQYHAAEQDCFFNQTMADLNGRYMDLPSQLHGDGDPEVGPGGMNNYGSGLAFDAARKPETPHDKFRRVNMR